MKLQFLLLVVFSAIPAVAQTQVIPVTGREVPAFAAYESALKTIMQRWAIPGAALAITDGGRLVYARGLGYADREAGIPVQPDSRFRFASLSKTLTGMTILKLAEEGRLSLDAKFLDLIPNITPIAGTNFDQRIRQITVRQLLWHTGGWDKDIPEDWVTQFSAAARALNVPYATLTPDLLCRYAISQRLDFDPGTRYSYSQTGYLLLGRIIEVLSGKKYEDAVREKLLVPAGVTSFKLGHALLSQRELDEVKYYDYPGAALVTTPVPPGAVAPAPRPYGTYWVEQAEAYGGWIGNAIDVMKYINALEGRRGRAILGPASLAAIVDRPPVTPTGAYVGLTWRISPISSGQHWWHSGGASGTRNLLARRQNNRDWVVLMNSRPEDEDTIINDIFTAFADAETKVTSWPTSDMFPEFDGPMRSFGHVAIGGGYSTVFTLLNTGSDTLSGNLLLAGQDGYALSASMTDGQVSVTGSAYPVAIPAGGAKYVTVASTNKADPTKAGWAKLSSTGGTFGGVATFQLTGANGALQTIAGVLSSSPVPVATIPVDDDAFASRTTGYAVANTGSTSITIGVSQVSADGRTVTALSDIQLGPGKQTASFFVQDPKAAQTFQGSVVLTGRNGATFAVVALVLNQNLLTTIPVISSATPNPGNTTFGHLAIGGGYSTVFTLLNTGTDALKGNLLLTGQDGNALSASMTDGQSSVTGSTFPVTIPAGGAKYVTVTSANSADPTKAGWARWSGTGGTFGGVATFQLTGSNGALQTIAGVLSSAPVPVATIPVDDDAPANRVTGYAVANTGNSNITIGVSEVSADGRTVTALSDIQLGPGKQTAAFFVQDPKAGQTFKGSVILTGRNGATFCAVGLVQNQGLFTAIPAIAGKAPNTY